VFYLQYRVELFNIANNSDFGSPNGDICSTARGVITSIASGRDIQLGLKLIR